ncbi:hypothetical protein NMG60_11006403 [Bertholletia excelsa]
MGTEVQAKAYFSESYSVRDRHVWAQYHARKSLKNDQHYNPFLIRPPVDGYLGFSKELLRQTILKHESIFRQQLEELHRLYERQRYLMSKIKRRELNRHPITAEKSQPSLSSSHITSGDFSLRDLTFRRPPTLGTNGIQAFVKVQKVSEPFTSQDRLRSWLEEDYSIGQSCAITYEGDMSSSLLGSGLISGCSGDALRSKLHVRKEDMVDLNEPFWVEETSVSASIDNFGNVNSQGKKIEPGGEAMNSKSGLHNLSKESSLSLLAKRDVGICLNNGHSMNDHNYKQHLVYKNDAVSGQRRCRVDSLIEVCPNDSPPPPKWLQPEPSEVDNPSPFFPCGRINEEPRRKRKLFGVEIAEGNDNQSDTVKSASSSPIPWSKDSSIFTRDVIPLQENTPLNNRSNTMILGFPISVPQICISSDSDRNIGKKDIEVNELVEEKGTGDYSSGLRYHFDLNLGVNENEAPPVPALPKSIVKIATTEIDLEAPAILEPETGPSSEVESLEDHQLKSHSELEKDEPLQNDEELVNVAAEAIIAMSSSSDLAVDITSLCWFAEVVSSYPGNLDCDEEFVPDGLDYFEFMTLNLMDMEVEERSYKPQAVKDEKDEETVASIVSERPRRGQGRRGRQRRDFQRDILPGLISLSRHEVTEDLQAIEEVFKVNGFTWQPSHKNASRNGRGRRRLVVSDLPLEATTACHVSDLALKERSLIGWGRRIRRQPRGRCLASNPTGGLKCG